MDPLTQEVDNSSVEVNIFDQAYNLCGPDPDYILKLAEYVDAKMRAIAGETHTTDSEQLAVLAALRIANEYHLLKTKLEDEKRETSGEEATMQEADSSDYLGGEVGQPRKPFTEEDRQWVRESRKRHHTRRWYEKQLLAIANGEVVPTKEQQDALLALGRSRGYHRRPTVER